MNYAKTGKCIHTTAADFNRLIKEYSTSLRMPLSLVPRGGFISAMQMYDDWNDIALLAEFSEEYFSFYWSTTA